MNHILHDSKLGCNLIFTFIQLESAPTLSCRQQNEVTAVRSIYIYAQILSHIFWDLNTISFIDYFTIWEIEPFSVNILFK